MRGGSALKKNKALKIILIALAAVLLLAAAALTALGILIKSKSSEIVSAVNEIISDEEIVSEIQQYLDEDTLSELGLSADLFSFPITEEDEAQSAEDSTDAPSGGNKADRGGKNDKSSAASAPAGIKNYEQIKEDVDKNDLARAMQLAGKVDVSYILGLLKGGLTAEEKAELKAYLKQRLSGSEISDGISLYTKYSYLLK